MPSADWSVWDLFQNLFLSPLIGALMGLALGWWQAPPPGNRLTIRSSHTNVVNSFNTVIHNHYYGPRDESGEGFISLAAMAAIIFAYANYGMLVLQLFGFLAALIVGFGIMFSILEAGAGAEGWLIRFVWPVVVALVGGYLLLMALGVMIQLRGQPGGLSFSTVIANIFSKYGAYVAFQAVGTACVGAALLGGGMALVYYACLGSLSDPGDIHLIKWRIAAWTRRFAKASGIVFVVLQLVFGWLLIGQFAYQWVWS